MDDLDYKTLIEGIPDFIYIHDLDGRFLEVNKSLITLLRCERNDLIGRNITEFIHPRCRQEFFEECLKTLRAKKVVKGLITVSNRDGETRLLEYHSRVVERNGCPPVVQGVARDVSVQKRLEKELADREVLYRALFENAADAIFLMEGEIFIDCNPKAVEMFGCKEKPDIVQKPPYLFSPEFQPDGQLSREKALKKIRAALNGVPQRFEWVHTRLDGTPFNTIVSLFQIDVQKRQLIVAMVHDISAIKNATKALQESEQNYRELVENANVIIYRFTPDGTFTFINKYGEEFFGYSRDELIGKKKTVGTIIPKTGEKSQSLREMFQDLCAHPERYYEHENENVTRDGRTVYIKWRNQPIRDANGNVREILSIGTDVTKIRELENELLQAKKLEAIGTLAGGIAHDFNNILGGIMGYVSLLKERHAPDDSHYAILEKIENAGLRASDLIKQLLAFSRRGKYENRNMEINEKIRNVIDILKHSAPKKVTFDLELMEGLPEIVGDPSQIEQVFMNTCLNAIQAMPDGGRLRIVTSLDNEKELQKPLFEGKPDKPYVSIVISDTGVGMDEETKEHIFEPFFTTKPVGKGTGLGLSTVYGIVKNHGGGVTVESTKGKGTTFRFYFPAAEGAATAPGTKEARVKRDRGLLQGKGKILVADDEEVFRDMLKDVLEYLGYDVLTARDGKEGLEVFKRHQSAIDLVILDMNMPVMDGKEMFRELKKLSPDVKALLATGFTLNGAVQTLMDEGVMGFIQKPFRIEEISKAINALMSMET